MNGRVRVLSVLVIMAISLLAAGPAAAGGPTSVLLSDPEGGRVAALHASGSDYGALATYVDAFSNSGQAAPADAPDASDGSTGTVRLTWLIHDVQVWRVDTVYLTAKGGPWIETHSSMDGSTDIWNTTAVWHKVTDPQRLTALLTKLGVNPLVPAADSPAPAGEAATVAPAPVAVTTPPAAPATGTPEAATVAQGWTWGLIGLVAGVVLAAAGGLLWSHRRPTETPPTTPDAEPSPDTEPSRDADATPDVTSDVTSAPAETITV